MSSADRAVAIARWAEGQGGQSAGNALTTMEQYRLVIASEQGRTLAELAETFGRPATDIERVLVEWADSRPAAKRLLNARALQLAEQMIVDAEPGIALEILERLSVVDASSKGGASGLTIQIGGNGNDVKIALLEQPALKGPQ